MNLHRVTGREESHYRRLTFRNRALPHLTMLLSGESRFMTFVASLAGPRVRHWRSLLDGLAMNWSEVPGAGRVPIGLGLCALTAIWCMLAWWRWARWGDLTVD